MERFRLYCPEMKPRPPIKYQEQPIYPSDSEVMQYAEIYRKEYMPLPNPDKAFHRFENSRFLDVLVIGGIARFFIVYSYPPGGFEVADTDEVEALDAWRGWVLKYLGPGSGYTVDTSTEEDGIPAFLARKTELGY